MNKMHSPHEWRHGTNATSRAQQRPRLSRRLLSAGMALGLAAAMSGCALMFPPKPPAPPPPPPPPKPPPKLAVRIAALARLNPDANGRPSPVVVRVYELKAVAQFNAADFMAMFEQDRSVLGADVVAREEFVMQPGSTKAIDKLLSPDAQALAVMAAFRELDRAQWRGLVNLAPGKDNVVTIELEDVAVKLRQSATEVRAVK